MSSYLIDINVWIALTWDRHSHHSVAIEWWNSQSADCAFLFCRFTMLGFLRLLTTRQVMGDRTMVVADALGIYDRLFADSRVQLRQEPTRISKALRLALEPVKKQAAPKAISDCYLIAFAETSSAHLVTMDKALAGLGQQRQIHVELLKVD